MALYRTNAIVLRTRNIGEADRILVLLSEEHGKFEAVVKGARRPRSRFLGNTLAFNYLKVMLFRNKNLDTLSQAELIHSFSKLREDLFKMAYASYWVELIDGFVPERQAVSEVFRFLLASFITLEKTTAPEMLNLAFQLRLLYYLGYQPQINGCIHCGSSPTTKLSFSAQAGGIICMDCQFQYRDGIEMSLSDIQSLKQLSAVDLRQLDNFKIPLNTHNLLQKLLQTFIETRLERPIKSQVFLDNLSG